VKTIAPAGVFESNVRRYAPLVAALVIVAGFALRVWNVNFDRGIGSHPDERSTACFYATTIRLPTTWEQFWDPQQSPLNPLWDSANQTRRSFTYGHFPLYLGVAFGETLHRAAPLAERIGLSGEALSLMDRANRDCDAIAVAGRLTMAILDTLTIWLLFLLGRRIFSAGAGVLAATFYAFSAQAIQLSHFFAMDPASTTFTVLAVYGSVRMLQESNTRSAILAGVGAGLAISSKFSALPVLAAPVSASALVVILEQQRAYRKGRPADGALQFRAIAGACLALIVAGLSFFLTSPYSLLDWQNFIQATLIEQGRMVRGIADMPFTRQYRNTTPYLYFIYQQVAWGLWWPLGVVTLGGVLAMLADLAMTLWRLVRNWMYMAQEDASGIRLPARFQASSVIVWSWVLPYFVITGAFLAKFNRYMIPVLPFAVLLAAGAIWRLWRLAPGARFGRRDYRLRRISAGILAAIGIVGGVFWSLAYVNGVYRGEHTWITASRWIYENVPQGSVILWELWDDPLPKAIPGEPGMDMGSRNLRNIDWSPYEEDTAEKYNILKAKLREADYVAYSSKRIYDSVDELPERYPMTTLYYEAMRDGRLGYEVALEASSPPRLFSFIFDDRTADESWSLYDHPQVTVLRKVRDLSDAEFDAVLGGSWEDAIPYYTGQDSPLSPILTWLGLRGKPGAEYSGLMGTLMRFAEGRRAEQPPEADQAALLGRPIVEYSVTENIRWNRFASERTAVAALVWWLALSLLGWAAWPVCFTIFASLRDRGYFVSRMAGWLAAGWLLWYLTSYGIAANTIIHAWLCAGVVAVVGIVFAVREHAAMGRFLVEKWPMLVAGETGVTLAYVAFLLIRMANPDLWQPWFGGEKFMEFAFLNGILRSASFPPADPHFAGGYINYYYFGIYLAAYLIKLTGIYAETAFNLTIAALFALTVSNAFCVAYSAWAWGRRSGGVLSWRSGFWAAWIAPLFVVVIGNLDGFAQVVRRLAETGGRQTASALAFVPSLADAAAGLGDVLAGRRPLPAYDFWAPSRVIPNTINEFPYWSFLFADLHPHLIGIPVAILFCAAILALLSQANRDRVGSAGLLLALAFMLGTLSSVNLWELPTYFALGSLAFVVSQFRASGRIHWPSILSALIVFAAGAYLFYLPFFTSYVNVGASGVGIVRAPDDPGDWLLIWGFFGFLAITWAIYATAQPARRCRSHSRQAAPAPACAPTGLGRIFSLAFRQFDRLPRLIYLHQLLVGRPSLSYLGGIAFALLVSVGGLAAMGLGHVVLGLCLIPLALVALLLWHRDADSDPAALFIALLTTVAFAVLAGTQVVYLRDFLQGGEWYRMNTLFKFFSQVWVLLGLATAIALPRMWSGVTGRGQTGREENQKQGRAPQSTSVGRLIGITWAAAFWLLLVASLAFTFLGTPARLSQRMIGWRPEFGTINGMDYMRQGSYTWPDDSNRIELEYDWQAIRWLLDNVRGSLVVVETSEADYYRAGASRVSSMTGFSGLRGMHASEQRSGEIVSAREAQHREFWETPDIGRTLALIEELDVTLIYSGQLERYLHPGGVQKLEDMAALELLEPIYINERTTIFAVPGRLVAHEDGYLAPALGEGDGRAERT